MRKYFDNNEVLSGFEVLKIIQHDHDLKIRRDIFKNCVRILKKLQKYIYI